MKNKKKINKRARDARFDPEIKRLVVRCKFEKICELAQWLRRGAGKSLRGVRISGVPIIHGLLFHGARNKIFVLRDVRALEFHWFFPGWLRGGGAMPVNNDRGGVMGYTRFLEGSGFCLSGWLD